MKTLPVILMMVVAIPALATELFRYRGSARDGGTLEYVFETDAMEVQPTISKEKVAEIAADFMTTFYGLQSGALEAQEFRQQPIPFWLVCFADTVKGALHQLFFVVVPDGKIIEPMVEKRL